MDLLSRAGIFDRVRVTPCNSTRLGSASRSTWQERVRGSSKAREHSRRGSREQDPRQLRDRELVQADNRAGIALSSRTPATLELCSRAGCSRRHERHTFRHGAAFPTNWKRTTRLTAKGEKKGEEAVDSPGTRLVRAKRGRVNIITTSLCPDRRYASAASAADSRIRVSAESRGVIGPRWESFGGIYVKAVSRRMLIFARVQYSGYRDTRGVRVIAGERRRSVMEDTIRGFYARLRESARET